MAKKGGVVTIHYQGSGILQISNFAISKVLRRLDKMRGLEVIS